MNNIEKIKLLNSLELRSINGGSEVTDGFWYGFYAIGGYTARLWEIWTANSHNSRFR